MKPIVKLRAVHMETAVFDATVDFYERCFGLSLINRDSDRAILAGAKGAGQVLEISKGERSRLLGMTLAMASKADLTRSATALAAQGIAIEAGDPKQPGSFALRDPDGHRLVFVADDAFDDPAPTDDGRPLFVSHVVINSPQQDQLIAFYVDVLGFKIADRYEGDLLVFLRCRQPQHHCLGISPGEAATLNHVSFDLGSIDGLMKGVGRMRKNGREPIWGPGRHGPGGNVFCYYEDPAGFVPEFTCDVIQIDDEAAWVAKAWPRVPEIANVWGTGGPSPRALELMSGQGR